MYGVSVIMNLFPKWAVTCLWGRESEVVVVAVCRTEYIPRSRCDWKALREGMQRTLQVEVFSHFAAGRTNKNRAE